MNNKTDCTNVQIDQLNVDAFFPIRNNPFFNETIIMCVCVGAQVNDKKTKLSLAHTFFLSLSLV
jgi:hypothetical protein